MTEASGLRPLVVDIGVFAAGLTACSLPLAERYRLLRVGHELSIAVHTIGEMYFGAAMDSWGRNGCGSSGAASRWL